MILSYYSLFLAGNNIIISCGEHDAQRRSVIGTKQANANMTETYASEVFKVS
jgi:hypothetical protein